MGLVLLLRLVVYLYVDNYDYEVLSFGTPSPIVIETIIYREKVQYE